MKARARPRRRSLSWAQLPLRVLSIGALSYPRCAERLCADAFETEELFARTVAPLRHALARSVEAPVPRAGLGLEDARPEPPQAPLCAKVAGFSLHAAQSGTGR